jgi:phosphoglycerate dehydrogenase-like enzyme
MNWLVASRKYVQSYESQKAHVWEKQAAYMQGMHDQVGKKVGILGYGSIGRQSMFHPVARYRAQHSNLGKSNCFLS